MSEVNISIHGRIYEIGCDSGQEGRIVDLAAYIDQRLHQISRSGAAYNDSHLLILTALVLTDEQLARVTEKHTANNVTTYDFTVGLNWFLLDHNAKVQLNYIHKNFESSKTEDENQVISALQVAF